MYIGFLKLLWMALDDLMLKILLVAAIISIVIEMIFSDHREIAWIEGAAILVAVAVVSLVTAWNDYKKESQFIALSKFSEARNNIKVRRNKNEPTDVNINELKTGDVCQITPGMDLPCDAILVEGTGVTCNESAMTGESIELKKDTLKMCKTRQEEHEMMAKENQRDAHDIPSPLLLSGTTISTGEGWFMIIVVGKNSCVGKI